jgi:hypothetical protein
MNIASYDLATLEIQAIQAINLYSQFMFPKSNQ